PGATAAPSEGRQDPRVTPSSEVPTRPLRLLLATSEFHPYSKSGGLADMVSALAKALGRAGHQVGVVTPLYRGIRERFPDVQWFDYRIDVPLGSDYAQAEV